MAPEFLKLNKLAIALGGPVCRVPRQIFQNMMTMLRRQDVQRSYHPGGLGESAACSVQLRDGAIEPQVCRKIAGRREPPKRHDEPDGSYPAWFLCGRRPREYAAGFRKYQQRYGHYQAGRVWMLQKPSVASRHGQIRRRQAGESAGNACKFFRPRWMRKILRA